MKTLMTTNGKTTEAGVTETSHGRRVLVVEDEYFLADDMRVLLTQSGMTVLGPVASVADALALALNSSPIDAAVLDINLNGDPVFPVADALVARGVPIAFATGYDQSALPARFADVPRLEKPVKAQDLIATLTPLLAS